MRRQYVWGPEAGESGNSPLYTYLQRPGESIDSAIAVGSPHGIWQAETLSSGIPEVRNAVCGYSSRVWEVVISQEVV